VHHSEALRREPGGTELQEAVVSGDVEALPVRLRALREYALALTKDPGAVREDDVQALLDAGLTERDVIDANQVVAYFNYVNRVASGLGVQLEDHSHQR
jgi:uncharacterized peroxidase-related enzyme